MITDILNDHMPVGESLSIETSSLIMGLSRKKAADLPSELKIGDGVFKMPSFCDMLNQPTASSTPPSQVYNPNDENNCTNKILNMKSSSIPMAPAGHNGNNETNIGFSSLISLSFRDSSKSEIEIKESKFPFDFRVPRDKNLPPIVYQRVNATNVSISAGAHILPNSFHIKSNNASIHINIKPLDLSIGYLVLLKFGYTPILNSTYADYNHFKVLCPYSSDYVTLSNDSFYLFFLNSAQVNGHKGFVGYGIRELTSSELNTYCIPSVNNTNKLSLKSPPLLANSDKINFTKDFLLLSYTSGCYYYESASGKWSSHGTEVVSDTNLYETHCLSTHLTSFAGGLVVLPSAINFEYVFANASFLQNPIIYSTVIVVTLLYVLFSVWAHLMDKRDLNKLNIIPLDDYLNNHNYFYEIIVFTGNRKDAATESKVKIVLNGDEMESEGKVLNQKSKQVFKRGAIDSFVMGVSR